MRAPLAAVWRRPLEDHLESLRLEAGLARASLASYRRDLERLARWASERGLCSWSELDEDALVEHLAWLAGPRRLAPASRARALAAARGFLRSLVREGELVRDPSARLDPPRLPERLPLVPTMDEIDRLLATPHATDWKGVRDRALLETLYASGARVSELCGLRTKDLAPGLAELRLFGKGSKTRLVPLGVRAREALRAWLEDARPDVPGAIGREELFLNDRGRPLTRGGAWRIVERTARAAGLGRITPHTLRHAFASHLVQNGADLRAVQELLGHASIQTTQVYTHLDTSHVRRLHEKYHPRG